MRLWKMPTAVETGPSPRHLVHRLLRDRGMAALETHRADDIVRHRRVVDLLHLVHVHARRLLDENMLARVQAIQRWLQQPRSCITQ